MTLPSPHVRSASELDPELDLICFSHLRWSFVTQRPQHLMRRAAKTRRVFYWEEPVRHGSEGLPSEANALSREELGGHGESARYALEAMPSGAVTVLRPHVCTTMSHAEVNAAQEHMLHAFLHRARVQSCIAWYYTPMALAFTSALRPAVTVYDCMDELSLFHGAPPELRNRELQLLHMADVVFTGGESLYEAKRHQHTDVHAFPSSIDVRHFAAARSRTVQEPADQAEIEHPRVGFCGVLDERLDIELLAQTARLLPEVHFVLIGPVVKIDPATLPAADNLHYLGSKQYEELPAYMSGWKVGLLPFAKNEATRFISPTKTPEYLAAGLPVVSTSIRDVVRGYGEHGLVAIADKPEDFAKAIRAALLPSRAAWRQAVDRKLAQTSWDRTWSAMEAELGRVLGKEQQPSPVLADWPVVARDKVQRLLLQGGARNKAVSATVETRAQA